ncbi:hypothetical protein GUITHDRAFT_64004 [Guillardia theta CCMP2712]|uniref:Aspartate aminotransferase n=1 Tax=Guillardia theta (strain CCMP2712) TaxID=905079 RepID=L1JZR7_GUITC|nr:hypothetical protein GUITHDRAFT_64004 [Guillardia theta CCMP2712]EKX53618.1 hypothetical protein GUITHDRAFT_64004 [Guillardia theta CCMP2712]|eukprot:XP_005840598.1 hypothetical protein GUITHDRAFT_64004 [Guillardia theta CCMP2712]
MVHAGSMWSKVEMAPPDPILGVAVEYNKDPSPKKVNLGIGAYRDDNGKPLVLKCVREAERKIANDESMNKEYLPIQGLESFLSQTSKIIFGDESPAIKEQRVAVVQSLSGTGALRLAAEFIALDPSWGNHHTIFKKAGLQTKTYKYLSPDMSLDFDGMKSDVQAAPKGSIFIFHTIAHNPTGVDLSHDQWKEIAKVCQEKEHIIIFDTAYQGYATGDLESDAWAVKYFAHEMKMELFVTQSYSKNFGLYGERIGALNVLCNDAETAVKVQSQLKGVIRPMYSSPQLHGARLVSTVLSDNKLKDLWKVELKQMSQRITEMRSALVRELTACQCPFPNEKFSSWNHIVKQIGMFAYTGLSAQQCAVLTQEHHIYCTKNGRFSMAGVNPGLS